jgi:hypothetical protein
MTKRWFRLYLFRASEALQKALFEAHRLLESARQHLMSIRAHNTTTTQQQYDGIDKIDQNSTAYVLCRL